MTSEHSASGGATTAGNHDDRPGNNTQIRFAGTLTHSQSHPHRSIRTMAISHALHPRYVCRLLGRDGVCWVLIFAWISVYKSSRPQTSTSVRAHHFFSALFNSVIRTQELLRVEKEMV